MTQGEDDMRALDGGGRRRAGLDIHRPCGLAQSCAFGRIVEEDVISCDIEHPGREKVLAEALADLAEADQGDAAGKHGDEDQGEA